MWCLPHTKAYPNYGGNILGLYTNHTFLAIVSRRLILVITRLLGYLLLMKTNCFVKLIWADFDFDSMSMTKWKLKVFITNHFDNDQTPLVMFPEICVKWYYIIFNEMCMRFCCCVYGFWLNNDQFIVICVVSCSRIPHDCFTGIQSRLWLLLNENFETHNDF